MFVLDYLKNFFQDTSNKFYYLSLIKEEDNTFSIHGLWPQYSDNSYPTFCKQVNFDIQQLQDLLPELNKVWYSNRNDNDDFWKHEYEKHGSCVFTQITEKEYFEKTLQLYNEALSLGLPDKYYNKNTKKCLIPIDLNFKFINN